MIANATVVEIDNRIIRRRWKLLVPQPRDVLLDELGKRFFFKPSRPVAPPTYHFDFGLRELVFSDNAPSCAELEEQMEDMTAEELAELPELVRKEAESPHVGIYPTGSSSILIVIRPAADAETLEAREELDQLPGPDDERAGL